MAAGFRGSMACWLVFLFFLVTHGALAGSLFTEPWRVRNIRSSATVVTVARHSLLVVVARCIGLALLSARSTLEEVGGLIE